MMKVWQVVIVGCHPTSMLGTKLILEEEEGLKVLGMYSTWDEGATIVREKNPELVLVDYHMPEGNIESVLLNMKKSSPNSHFVVMTDEDGRELLQPLVELGASGIFSRELLPVSFYS